jgi:sigma-B regulation protein RsbU (phosphoserine phosphatase)
MHVLVVDDQGFWRCALEEALLKRGHRVTGVENAEKAWLLLDGPNDLDVVVTDWVMPGVSGLELCRQIRTRENTRYLPVILMTSRNAREDLATALEAGADAFLPKPFDDAELLAQLRMTERILALEARLESRITELRRAKEEIERDLAQAAEIQRSFMPSTPPEIPGVEFSWCYETCAQLGGDIFNVIRLSEHCVGMHVLDVSGHGTPAALHSVALSHVLHSHPQQGGLLKRIDGQGKSFSLTPPVEVAWELNRRFPLIERSGHYFTFLYGMLDLSTRRFRWVCAGHPGPVLIRRDGARYLDGGGVPIGVTPEATWTESVVVLAPGDAVVLLSDGVLETFDVDGEQFGLERVLRVVGNSVGRGIETTVTGLRLALEEFRKGEPQRDDVTIVGLRVL